eukprot:scaffold3795_cov334-Prasinococcus_capsulatus_cf.AAC.2
MATLGVECSRVRHASVGSSQAGGAAGGPCTRGVGGALRRAHACAAGLLHSRASCQRTSYFEPEGGGPALVRPWDRCLIVTHWPEPRAVMVDNKVRLYHVHP